MLSLSRVYGAQFNTVQESTTKHSFKSGSPGNTNNARRTTGMDNERSSTPMRSPPPLPVQRSCDIYYRHLAVKGRGSPMFLPEPSTTLPDIYRRQGIAIGDVGILTASGGFDFMFNICLPVDHPINQQGLPEGFSPISPPYHPSDGHTQMEFGPNSHLPSASFEKSPRENDSSVITSANEGAILTMPHGAYAEDLTDVSRFRKYVSANIESWYRYVNNTRGREARNGDVRLVIGCDKASSWEMATFASSTAQDFHLKFNLTGGSGFQNLETSGTLEERGGPDPQDMEALRSEDDSGHLGEYKNQCLFVRTMNATLRDDVWQGLGFEFETTVDNQCDFTRSSATSVYIADFISVLTGHPSKTMNDFILTLANPHPRIVITEDDDWTSLIIQTDQRLPPPEELINRMLTTYDVCELDGVVFLRLKQEDKGFSLSSEQTDQDINVPPDFIFEAEPHRMGSFTSNANITVPTSPLGGVQDATSVLGLSISDNQVPGDQIIFLSGKAASRSDVVSPQSSSDDTSTLDGFHTDRHIRPRESNLVYSPVDGSGIYPLEGWECSGPRNKIQVLVPQGNIR